MIDQTFTSLTVTEFYSRLRPSLATRENKMSSILPHTLTGNYTIVPWRCSFSRVGLVRLQSVEKNQRILEISVVDSFLNLFIDLKT